MRGAGEGDSHEQRIVADCLQTAKTFVIRAVLSLLYESLAVLQLIFCTFVVFPRFTKFTK